MYVICHMVPIRISPAGLPGKMLLQRLTPAQCRQRHTGIAEQSQNGSAKSEVIQLMWATQVSICSSSSNRSHANAVRVCRALCKVHVCFCLPMTKAPLAARVTHHLDGVMQTP